MGAQETNFQQQNIASAVKKYMKFGVDGNWMMRKCYIQKVIEGLKKYLQVLPNKIK